ncbi:AraC family transcriptional regulator [Mucilaginibacter conchicola]|uniref:AraC family transcriptional regulator n=1 Tax=Mucilaginibacter conchicola TaxID=2303333 RepID=A0A372NV41_9SPHI|nr:helix-turn-helix domain-containing protein [Mucilaginibacter conchicola]RFZ92904.1 AraC family transcriptional regulator [Mucilaginibacter conchicola]
MRKTKQHIPVYGLPPGSNPGIMLMREAFNGSMQQQDIERAHRDGGFTFIVQEEGKTHLEVDFQTCYLSAPAIIFIHPSQIHRVIAFESAVVSTWMITEENLRPEYLQLLNGLMPVNALPVKPEIVETLSEAAALSLKLAEQKEGLLHHPILQDSCNTLVGLVISQYQSQGKATREHTRTEELTRSFKQYLEHHFKSVKTPSAYAASLNITTSYLNECVKAATGKSVSQHIRQRVILEAKRLLYHSTKSIKEISADLGYDDHSYFSRLFARSAGMTPAMFRVNNRH